MASDASAYVVYREQIADNVRFFSGRYAQVDIITTREPLGLWKVYAVKSGSSTRDVVICESADTLLLAYERLHIKSAESLHNFLSTNGFGYAKNIKTRTLRSRDEEDSADSDASLSPTLENSEIISVCNSSSDSDDDGFVSMTAKKTKSRRHKDNRKSRTSKTRGSRDSDVSSSESDTVLPQKRASPSPVTLPPIVPAFTARSHPPPPPPKWHLAPPQRQYQRPGPPAFSMPLPLPPPPAPYKAPSPATPVALTINWVGHGDVKVVEPCRPSLRALLDTAVNYVRSHHTSFTNTDGPDMVPSKLWGLRASVKRVCLSKTMYHISSFSNDDITSLFRAADFPRFEIEVDFPVTPAVSPPHSQR